MSLIAFRMVSLTDVLFASLRAGPMATALMRKIPKSEVCEIPAPGHVPGLVGLASKMHAI